MSYDEARERYKARSAQRHEDWLNSWYGGAGWIRPKASEGDGLLGSLWWVLPVLFLAGAAFVIWECHELGLF